MVSFLEGTIEHLGDKYVILNTGGVGYKVTIVPKLANILSKSRSEVGKVKLFIHSKLNMREGTFDMYGFSRKEDLDLFNLITTVSGIGPKGALTILSSVEPSHLKAAIVNEDANYLKKVSNLNPKIANRLVLELKNKVDHIDIGEMKGIDLGQEGQAVEALLVLGYSQGQAKEALKEAKGNRLEDRVREALKILGKK
ncbi:MAG: Holliday junction DNA helicase RuvA [Candidatus Yanofskybacteria bacterium RIFCSPHIGHO2_02_FULL_41_11]|uniref:Holliday junction branch migration complex subunit RuvA n=1 Tax=Candidatus Yanofskybacteria bacterium RIFCSPHIGHO2_02_FULL_41_11 TaxID=1802675 RepID=A0A1F8F7W8_9BACT|nr:MAG: Holliday junction DNA helicase RuvA [Candidatus Yanofskybacteria bacterium RIFCSPHIGHO2_02_FULL_41_11]